MRSLGLARRPNKAEKKKDQVRAGDIALNVNFGTIHFQSRAFSVKKSHLQWRSGEESKYNSHIFTKIYFLVFRVQIFWNLLILRSASKLNNCQISFLFLFFVNKNHKSFLNKNRPQFDIFSVLSFLQIKLYKVIEILHQSQYYHCF